MKHKFIIWAIAMCIATLFSCKPNYEASKAAYERAVKAAVDRPTYTVDTPTDDAITAIQLMQPIDTSNEIKERRESIKPVENSTIIKKYSIVVGTFKQLTNARSMRDRLIEDQNNAFVVQNAQGKYFVVISTHDTREEACDARNKIMDQYPSNYVGNPWFIVL